MRVEQVNPSAMQRHYWRVGRLETVLDIHLQDAVLVRWSPTVGSEQVLHGVGVDTVGADDAGAEREQGRGAFHAERVGGAGEGEPVERRPSQQVVDHVQRVYFALERGPSGR